MKPICVALILVATAIQIAVARHPKRPPNQKAVMSALHNVFSQANNERTAQMVQMAQRRHLADETKPCMLQMPVKSVCHCQPKCPCQKIEPACPPPPCAQNIPVRPEIMPTAVIKPEVKVPCRTEVSVPMNRPEIVRVPVPYPVPMREPCENPLTPFFSLGSPFLPSASPISAWAPGNRNLPPVNPNQTRNHFLRKIPIPPPTL